MPIDDDLLATPALRRRFHAEADAAGDPNWFAFVRRAGGQTVGLKSGLMALRPDPHQQMFVLDLLGAMNAKIAHDGAWVAVLLNPKPPQIVIGATAEYDLMTFIWIDQDGDPQFSVEIEERLEVALSQGPDHWLTQMDAAHDTWRHHMRDVLQPKAGQLYKRAQGEAPPSAAA